MTAVKVGLIGLGRAGKWPTAMNGSRPRRAPAQGSAGRGFIDRGSRASDGMAPVEVAA